MIGTTRLQRYDLGLCFLYLMMSATSPSFVRLGQNLFTLQTAENLVTRQASFTANKAHSDDEVIWDDGEEDDDAGSNAAAEGSSATYGDDGTEELEDSGEPLSYSSKSPGPSSLRD
jgi:hypothetical protein